MKNLNLCLLTLILVGCGGGAGDSAPTATQQTQPATTTTTTPSTPTVETPKSTKFVDNSVPTSTEFNQFASFLSRIPDKTAEFKSKTVYLKLYTSNGNSLYLGRYYASMPIEIHVPNHIKTVKFDVFSADPTDPQISGELAL
jgi:hypothetical protein